MHRTCHSNLKNTPDISRKIYERYKFYTGWYASEERLLRLYRGVWGWVCSLLEAANLSSSAFQINTVNSQMVPALSPLPTVGSNASCWGSLFTVHQYPLWWLNDLPLLESGNQEWRKYKQEQDVECLLDAPWAVSLEQLGLFRKMEGMSPDRCLVWEG